MKTLCEGQWAGILWSLLDFPENLFSSQILFSSPSLDGASWCLDCSIFCQYTHIDAMLFSAYGSPSSVHHGVQLHMHTHIGTHSHTCKHTGTCTHTRCCKHQHSPIFVSLQIMCVFTVHGVSADLWSASLHGEPWLMLQPWEGLPDAPRKRSASLCWDFFVPWLFSSSTLAPPMAPQQALLRIKYLINLFVIISVYSNQSY